MATKTVNPVDEVTKLRERITGLQAEIKALNRNTVLRPQVEAEGLVKELVRRAAMQLNTQPGDLVAGQFSRLNASVGFGVIDRLNENEPFSLLCSLAPDLVEKALLESLAERYGDDTPVMDAATQQAELERLRSELFETEVSEEIIVNGLEVSGAPAPARRADVNPAALLDPRAL